MGRVVVFTKFKKIHNRKLRSEYLVYLEILSNIDWGYFWHFKNGLIHITSRGIKWGRHGRSLYFSENNCCL